MGEVKCFGDSYCVYKIRTKPKASVIANLNATDILLSQLSLFFRFVPSKLLGNPSIFKFIYL